MADYEYLVEVEDLQMHFPVKTGFFKTTPLKAVDGVSFNIKPGETLGLVGESGCGKTTVGRTLLHLYEPTGGTFKFKGEEVTSKNIGRLRKEMQMVFQDPYSSLNPRMTVEDIIGEPLDVHHLYESKEDRREQVLHLMDLVGLNAEHATRYAHEFSGGQRQRIGIARALAVHPSFIVCDEPVSAPPTTSWWSTTFPTALRSCTSDASWRSRMLTNSMKTPSTPIPCPCCLRCACRTPSRRSRTSASSWRAMYLPRSTCPADARSGPVAATRPNIAQRKHRASQTEEMDTWLPAGTNDPSRRVPANNRSRLLFL